MIATAHDMRATHGAAEDETQDTGIGGCQSDNEGWTVEDDEECFNEAKDKVPKSTRAKDTKKMGLSGWFF